MDRTDAGSREWQMVLFFSQGLIVGPNISSPTRGMALDRQLLHEGKRSSDTFPYLCSADYSKPSVLLELQPTVCTCLLYHAVKYQFNPEYTINASSA